MANDRAKPVPASASLDGVTLERNVYGPLQTQFISQAVRQSFMNPPRSGPSEGAGFQSLARFLSTERRPRAGAPHVVLVWYYCGAKCSSRFHHRAHFSSAPHEIFINTNPRRNPIAISCRPRSPDDQVDPYENVADCFALLVPVAAWHKVQVLRRT